MSHIPQPDRKKVVVAMSGGVDSSVAAALLVKAGYEVIGMMLRLWSEPGREDSNRCCTPDAMAQARRVAAHLGIPFYAIDAKEEFRQVVVKYFLDGYTQGITPNPCLVCNKSIRWTFLLSHALAIGADHLATGHYARLHRLEDARIQLLRGCDHSKDQSYILHVLNQEQLSRTLFPIGHLTKHDVRSLAQQMNLPVANRPESQDLCFLAGDNYRNFLKRHALQSIQPGAVLNSQGEVIGEHQGLAFYTIGQRKGLPITTSHPLYVREKIFSENALVLAERDELGNRKMSVRQINWTSIEPPEQTIHAHIKIRYKSPFVPGSIEPVAGERATVTFEYPVRDITPGQAAVFYDGDICLGGGLIEQTED